MQSRWMAVLVVAAMFACGSDGMAQRGGNAGACPQRPANCPQQPGCSQGGQVRAGNGQGQRLRLRQGQQQGQPAAGRGQGGRGAGAAGPRPNGAKSPACQGPCGSIGQQPLVLVPALLEQLQTTLASELYAHEFYLAAAQRFGGRRYANLARAERNHAEALARVVRSAGGEPVVAPGCSVELPEDLAGAAAAAVQIERSMIAAYEALLANQRAAALQPMLLQIQTANRRHLAANER